MNLPDPVENVVRNRRLRRVVIAVAAGGGLALGVSGLALADATTPAPTPSSSSGAAAPERRAHQPHLDGTVTSIAGGHILIVDRDGFKRQINFTGTADGVKAGVRVHAEGTVNADGVSLDATEVGVAPSPPAGRAGKDGRGGPRGPHGPGGEGGPHGPGGEGGPPPAGAPSSPPAAPAPSATS